MITCKNCGSVDDYRVEQKSNNRVATCNHCDRYIKNIPHDKARIYIGKYKGKAVDEIDDLPYLNWLFDNVKLNAHVAHAVGEQIRKLENLMK